MPTIGRNATERLICAILFSWVNVPVIFAQAVAKFAFGDQRRLINALFVLACAFAVLNGGAAAATEGGGHGKVGKPVLRTFEESPYLFTSCDCSGPGVRYVNVDLLETEPCAKEEGDFEEPYEQRVMILQTDGHETIDVVNCEIRFSKEVTRCGKTHINYGSTFVARDEIIYPSREECLRMAKEGYYDGVADQTTLGGFPIVKLQDGVWNTDAFYSKGGRDLDGNCIWDSWLYRGENYRKSYEETVVKVRFRNLKGHINRRTGILTIATAGIQATYAETMVDDVEGIYVWELAKENCTEHTSNVYDDFATVHRVREEKRKSSDKFDGSVLTFTNTETQQSGGFVVSKERDACLPDCHRTHVQGLIACLDPHRIRHKIAYQPGQQADIKMLQIAMSHMQLTDTFKVNGKFTAIAYDNCETRRYGTEHQLADVAGNDNPYALRNVKISGIGKDCRQFLHGGASGYVASCPKVNVTMVPYDNCTLEVPVVYADDALNETAIVHFVDPITLIMQSVPTISVCSPAMPIKWRINSKWYCATPVTHECDAPHQLSTTMGTTGLSTSAGEFPGVGQLIYSPEQIKKNQEFLGDKNNRRPIAEQNNRKSIKNTIPARRGQGVHFGMPFSTEDLDSLSIQMALRILPLFALLGQSYSIIVGAIFLLGVLKLIIGCGLRIGVLYQKKGFGIWLLTAVWSTLFTLWGLPWKIAKKTYSETMGGLDHALQNLEPKTYAQLTKHIHGIVKVQEAQRNANLHRDAAIRALVSGIAGQEGPFRAVAVKVLADIERPLDQSEALETVASQATAPEQLNNSAANNGDETTDTLLP